MAKKKKVAAKKSAGKKKSTNKTVVTNKSVATYVASITHEGKRKDAKAALALLKNITGLKPKMWGASIIGFGEYHYKYDSGREGDHLMTGFSSRAASLVFYLMGGVPENDPLFKKLGKYKLGRSCLYINKLDDVDIKVLEKMIRQSVAYMKKNYPTKP